MIQDFVTLSPNWNIPNIHAYTVLASAKDGSPISFSRETDLGKMCRQKLEDVIKPEVPIVWLRQKHGKRILNLPQEKISGSEDFLNADGMYTLKENIVCVIQTADCLPIIFTDKAGTQVGAVHAGRRGLENGIIFEMRRLFNSKNSDILAWIGPGIAARSYRISTEIRNEFLKINHGYDVAFTKAEHDGQFYMDLYQIARIQLEAAGLNPGNISGASWDTFSDKRFHSARRDGEASGRMATLIFMK